MNDKLNELLQKLSNLEQEQLAKKQAMKEFNASIKELKTQINNLRLELQAEECEKGE